MTKYEIIFTINDTHKISIPLKDPIEFLGPIYREKILLVLNKHKILLSKSTIYHDMLDLTSSLKKALAQEFFPDCSITKDFGHLHNEYLYNSINPSIHTLEHDTDDWPGYTNLVWSSTAHFDTWIYNAADGSIIFEVTPVYPYLFSEPEEEPDYIPYAEWIKTYKPYFITTLSKETALEWIEQADKIIWMVEFNEKRMQYRSKIDVES